MNFADYHITNLNKGIILYVCHAPPSKANEKLWKSREMFRLIYSRVLTEVGHVLRSLIDQVLGFHVM